MSTGKVFTLDLNFGSYILCSAYHFPINKRIIGFTPIVLLSFFIASLDPRLLWFDLYLIRFAWSFAVILLIAIISSQFLATRILFCIYSLFLITISAIKIIYGISIDLTSGQNLIGGLFDMNKEAFAPYLTPINALSIGIAIISTIPIWLIINQFNRKFKLSYKALFITFSAYLFLQLLPLGIMSLGQKYYDHMMPHRRESGMNNLGMRLRVISFAPFLAHGWPWNDGICISIALQRQFLEEKFVDPNLFKSELLDDSPITVIHIIGESARADHAHINGYARKTTPFISNLKGSNCISFPGCVSYDTSTSPCVRKTLSGFNPNDEIGYLAYMHILKKHGFKNFGITDSKNADLLDSRRIKPVLTDCIDDLRKDSFTKEKLQESLQNISKDPAKRKMILVNLVGSHSPYIYSEGVTPFLPCNYSFGASSKIANIEKLVNAYDNSFVYTDDICKMIYEIFSDRKFALLFCSDHGESLSENGLAFHGNPLSTIAERFVFCFLLYSNEYKDRHPTIVENINSNSHKLISQEYIYDSILSICRINSDIQNNSSNFTTIECQDLLNSRENQKLLKDLNLPEYYLKERERLINNIPAFEKSGDRTHSN